MTEALPAKPSVRPRDFVGFAARFAPLIFLVVLMAGFAIGEPRFMTPFNLFNVMRQVSIVGLLAIGMTFVILTAGIDLSVGSVMALAIMLLAMADQAGWPWPIVILIGPAVGTLIGIINGLGITLLRLPHPFIMTLGTLNTVRGICYLVSDGHPVSGISDPVRFIGIADIPLPFGGEFAVIPVSAMLLLVCYFGVAIFLQKVSLGRHIFAVGGNPQAARVSGINVDGVLVFVYATSGFFAGVLVMGLLRNGLNLMDISAFWQQTLIGIVILLAVWIDVLRRRSGRRT